MKYFVLIFLAVLLVNSDHTLAASSTQCTNAIENFVNQQLRTNPATSTLKAVDAPNEAEVARMERWAEQYKPVVGDSGELKPSKFLGNAQKETEILKNNKINFRKLTLKGNVTKQDIDQAMKTAGFNDHFQKNLDDLVDNVGPRKAAKFLDKMFNSRKLKKNPQLRGEIYGFIEFEDPESIKRLVQRINDGEDPRRVLKSLDRARTNKETDYWKQIVKEASTPQQRLKKIEGLDGNLALITRRLRQLEDSQKLAATTENKIRITSQIKRLSREKSFKIMERQLLEYHDEISEVTIVSGHHINKTYHAGADNPYPDNIPGAIIKIKKGKHIDLCRGYGGTSQIAGKFLSRCREVGGSRLEANFDNATPDLMTGGNTFEDFARYRYGEGTELILGPIGPQFDELGNAVGRARLIGAGGEVQMNIVSGGRVALPDTAHVVAYSRTVRTTGNIGEQYNVFLRQIRNGEVTFDHAATNIARQRSAILVAMDRVTGQGGSPQQMAALQERLDDLNYLNFYADMRLNQNRRVPHYVHQKIEGLSNIRKNGENPSWLASRINDFEEQAHVLNSQVQSLVTQINNPALDLAQRLEAEQQRFNLMEQARHLATMDKGARRKLKSYYDVNQDRQGYESAQQLLSDSGTLGSMLGSQ